MQTNLKFLINTNTKSGKELSAFLSVNHQDLNSMCFGNNEQNLLQNKGIFLFTRYIIICDLYKEELIKNLPYVQRKGVKMKGKATPVNISPYHFILSLYLGGSQTFRIFCVIDP